MTTDHHRDLLIVDLSDNEARLIERVGSLEVDVDAYRVLAQQAINALHDVSLERDQFRQQNRHLADENRHLRARLVHDDAQGVAAA